MRRINEIKNLRISELSDEEICKVAMYRLEANFAMLIYLDKDGQSWFMGRWRNSKGRNFWRQLMNAWEGKFGSMKRLTDKTDTI